MSGRAQTVGVTGGIGSGKSSAVQVLADLGAVVIDADRVGHEVYAPGTIGFGQVVAAFGAGLVGDDGAIDRKRLGPIVFADPAALVRLNAIVHPAVARLRDAAHGRPDRCGSAVQVCLAPPYYRPSIPLRQSASISVDLFIDLFPRRQRQSVCHGDPLTRNT